MKISHKLARAASAWTSLEEALGPLSAVPTRATVNKAMTLIDELVAATEDPGAPPGLVRLLTFFTDWLVAYESTAVPTVSPVELLRHLMEVNDLKQADLTNELGGQSAVSEILRGKRQINAGQARRLAKRFGLQASAFIGEDNSPVDDCEDPVELFESYTSDCGAAFSDPEAFEQVTFNTFSAASAWRH